MARGDGSWSHLLGDPLWRSSCVLELMALAAVPALSAMVEFAVRGRGTPYPWDPPSELVTTGQYAYVANPMQVASRLGQQWLDYDAEVRPWRVRRTPYVAEPAALYLSETCTICRQTRTLVESTKPLDLDIRPAEGYTVAGLRRALYVGPDGLQARGLTAVDLASCRWGRSADGEGHQGRSAAGRIADHW